MKCKLLQYQGVPKVEIDNFLSMFNQVVEKKVSDQMGRLTKLFKQKSLL